LPDTGVSEASTGREKCEDMPTRKGFRTM